MSRRQAYDVGVADAVGSMMGTAIKIGLVLWALSTIPGVNIASLGLCIAVALLA